MNKSEIKRKIAELLGKTFFSFSSYKTKDGSEMRTESEKMEVGMPIYIVTPEGQLPVQEGEYEMENGMKIKVKEGMVTEIVDEGISEEGTPVDETAGDDVEMDEATLVDGTKVGTDGDFEVGKTLYVKDADDNWVKAPVGEHTTESGIVLVVDEEGVITGISKPDAQPEGSLETEEMSMESLLEVFTEAVNQLKDELSSIKNEQAILGEKFNKFSAEPAGEKIFDRKGYMDERNQEKFSKLEAISQIKNKK